MEMVRQASMNSSWFVEPHQAHGETLESSFSYLLYSRFRLLWMARRVVGWFRCELSLDLRSFANTALIVI